MKSTDYGKKAAFLTRCVIIAEKNNAPAEKIATLKNEAKKYQIMADEKRFMEHRFDKKKSNTPL